MSRAPPALIAWLFAFAPAAMGCSSSAPSISPDLTDASSDSLSDSPPDIAANEAADADGGSAVGKLDCAFAKDPLNCWRAFTASVDDCLGNVAAPSTAIGTLSGDGSSCRYPDARAIDFLIAVDPATHGVDRADRDFEARRAATSCLHYVERASVGGFVATSPAGTLRLQFEGDSMTLTCTDGSVFAGSPSAIVHACSTAVVTGGVPGRLLSGTADSIRFELTGMRDYVYSCKRSAADAGP